MEQGGQAAPAVAPPAVPAVVAPHPPGMVEALKEAFTADTADRELRHRREMEALRQAHAADLAAREESFRGELQARHAQLAAQHLELDSRHGEIAQLRAQVAELAQALAAEQQTSAHWNEQAQRLADKVRQVVSQSHDAALQAAGKIADAHDDAVRRGDHLEEQVALHEAAVNQLRSTIEQQRADRDQLMEERQAARTRCVGLESQLHALTADARHLAEGLQRVQAERDAERRVRDAGNVKAEPVPPRLRLAGSADSA